MKFAFIILMTTAWCIAGCAVNKSAMHLYMSQDELQRAIDGRYCLGMSADTVIEQVERDELVYFVERTEDEQVKQIEARMQQAGLQRETSPKFGRLLLKFEQGELSSVVYGHPVSELIGRWDYRNYSLENCGRFTPEVTP